jgi:tRNA threonylcarbamoyladenosine biosynthesis protein TsaE
MKESFLRRSIMTIETHSEAETERVGEALARKLTPGSVVAMYGGLGAGKTAFVRGMARALGAQCRVSSPTFTIVNEYPGKIPLFHFDMYRLGSADELFDIGWEDYLGRGGVCAVEWSENVPGAFEPGSVIVRIEHLGETNRKITIEGAEL